MWNKLNKEAKTRFEILGFATVISGCAIALSWTGALQHFEWLLLDTYFQIRPREPLEERIVVVGLTETDVRELGGWPIPDNKLAQLLNNLKKQNPRAIGLDIYRDLPVGFGYNELVKVFESTPELTGVQKIVGDEASPTIKPPATLEKLGQVSAVDVAYDGDRVVRRAILTLPLEGNKRITSLGLDVALKYLKKDGIIPKISEKGLLNLNGNIFTPLKSNDGGYVQADTGGYQILINFRGPAKSFKRISFANVINNNMPSNLVQDKIVLIGVVAQTINDSFFTPYNNSILGQKSSIIQTPGVELHAHLASRIISTVLNKRPLITTLNDSVENFVVFAVCIIFIFILWKQSFNKNSIRIFDTILPVVIVMTTGVIFSFIIICCTYLAFLQGIWLPSFPSLIALGISVVVFSCYPYIRKLNIAYQNFALALKASCTGIVTYNCLTDEISIVGNCDKLFGWKTESYFGSFSNLVNYIHPEDRETITEELKFAPNLIDERQSSGLQFRFTSAFDSIEWMSIKGRFYFTSTGKAVKFLGTIVNINSNKELQQELIRQINYQKKLLSHISDTIIILSYELIIQNSTSSIFENFGYSTLDVVNCHILDLIHPDDASFILQLFTQLLQKDTETISEKCRFLDKGGEWQWVQSIWYIEKATFEGVVLTIRNTTERQLVAVYK